MFITNWFLYLVIGFAFLGMFNTKMSSKLDFAGSWVVLIGSALLTLNALASISGRCNGWWCYPQGLGIFDSMIFLLVSLTSCLIHHGSNSDQCAESKAVLKVVRLIVVFVLGSFFFKDYVHFYFFYEVIGILFLYLIGNNLYFEKKRTFHVIAIISFSITLVNFLCIFSLYSLAKQEGNDFTIPLIVINNLVELHASTWWVKLIFRMQIVVLLIKALVLPFYFLKTGSSRTHTKFFIFLFMLVVNMLITAYATNTFLKEFLHLALLNNVNFLILGGMIILVFALSLFIRFKTLSDYFRLLVFLYSCTFIITYILFVTEKTVLDYIAVVDFVVVIIGLCLIERVFRERFGDPPLKSKLNLRHSMPRFGLIIFLWLMLLTGTPFFASGLIRISYANILFNHFSTGAILFYVMAFLFFSSFILFLRNIFTQAQENKITTKDISSKEVILLSLPLVFELLLSWQWLY